MIKITADSTCDLSPEILEKFNITLFPIHIMIDGKNYRDGVDIQPEDIFYYVGEEGKSVKTAAANAFEYEEFFAKYAGEYDAVIHVNIGSKFSSLHQQAKMAAENFDNVYVVDSYNLSTGSGHVVYEAVLMAKEGLDAEEICRRLEEMIPKVETSFVIDTLDYLYKGGRCSGMEALGASLLRIKPSIEVIDGEMHVGKKYRGKLSRCIGNYVKDRLADIDNIERKRIFVTHTMQSREIVEKVKEIVKQYDFEEIIETKAGCAVSSHCGPNTLGILYIRK